MPAEIKGKVSVDTSDLSRAGAATQSFEARLTSLFRRSPHMRAERAIDAFAQRLAAGDITGALESIAAKMTGLGLVAGVVFSTIGAFAVKAVEDMKALHKAISNVNETVGKGFFSGSSAEQAKTGFGETIKQIEELNKHRKSFFAAAADVATSDNIFDAARKRAAGKTAESTLVGRGISQLNSEASAESKTADLAAKKVSLRASEVALAKSVIDHEVSISKILDDQLSRRKAIADLKLPYAENVDANYALDRNLKARIDAAEKEHEAATKTIERDRAKELLPKTQLTMKELLEVDPRAQGLLREPARLARQVQTEEQLAERSRLMGDVAEAARHTFIAGQVRNQIGVLSEKEKQPELAFKSAIEGASVFQGMLAELMRITQGVAGISFANK